MKIPILGFILVLVGALVLGIAIQYYGRTCPACLRRKQKILDALSESGIIPPPPLDSPTAPISLEDMEPMKIITPAKLT